MLERTTFFSHLSNCGSNANAPGEHCGLLSWTPVLIFFFPPLYLFLYRCCFLFVWAELSLLTADYSQAAFPFVCQNFKKEVKVNSLFGITGRMSAGKTK